MSESLFSLQCFPMAEAGCPEFSVIGTVGRQAGMLCLDYVLKGRLSSLKLAPPAKAPERKDGLWQTTCLECFFSPGGGPGYWECNLSPAGHWNVFRFDSYRQGMAPEDRISRQAFTVSSAEGSLSLRLCLDFGKVVARDASLAIGVNAVLEDQAGALSFWALRHGGARPDFHRREDFLIAL